MGLPKTLPAKSRFLPVKQKADNTGDNEEENRAHHRAANSAEQHTDVGLTRQHPDRHGADEGAKDAGDRETPGNPDVSCLLALLLSTKSLVSITNDILSG